MTHAEYIDYLNHLIIFVMFDNIDTDGLRTSTIDAMTIVE